MAFINHEDISFSIKGWDGKKYIQVTHQIRPDNALFEKLDPSTALLKAFRTQDGTYFFKAGHHSEAAAADNIRHLARKAADAYARRRTAEVSIGTDPLPVREHILPSGTAGHTGNTGIIRIILELGTTTIRQYLGHTEGFYKTGNLYYPDKVLFDLI